MPRVVLAAALAAVALVTASPSGQQLEFDVASIKRNTSDRPTVGGPPPNPASGQLVLTWTPARFLATRAFPDLTTPILVEGLPAWADSERYDVTVKFAPGATAAEQAQMWRTLLADRMKLQAHYETRPRPAYRLVLARADKRLGPQLKPSTLTCPPPDPARRDLPPPEAQNVIMATFRDRRAATPQEEALLMSQCRSMFNAWNTIYAGALDMPGILMTIRLAGRLDRPVIDETSLDGLYAVKLWSAPPIPSSLSPAASSLAADLADAPSLFSAIQDQLGLKLESTTIDGRILVVDHIERPTEN